VAKLSAKGYDLEAAIEAFTVGDDPLLDQQLVEADCLGSVAHARMLARIGILKKSEALKLGRELRNILRDHQAGKFSIRTADEDVHTAVENRLTRKLGAVGQKIHAGRSRNDQVLVDLRLYGKQKLLEMADALAELCQALLQFGHRHRGTPMVGRTHMQKAMPSSVGLWAGAHLESLLDDFRLWRTAYELNDQCPLGSAASYGAALKLDREFVARELGFAKVQNNVLYANNSRGKIESIILAMAAQVTMDLSRLAQDLILFSLPEFGYFTLPQELCSGSSLMPQKRNPCGLELIRAKAASVAGCEQEILGILRGLPSGYNRDVQQTKGPFLRGLHLTLGCLRVATITIRRLKVNRRRLLAGFTPEVFATDRALELTAQGVPFRQAYRRVAETIDRLPPGDPVAAIRSRRSTGMAGNLRLDKAREALKGMKSFLTKAKKRWARTAQRLLK